MKVSELKDAMLDYWVARAVGIHVDAITLPTVDYSDELDCRVNDRPFRPTTDWVRAGMLIERYRISLDGSLGEGWKAQCNSNGKYGFGQTPLEAVCRALVQAEFGDAVLETPQTRRL